jgi:hypothetical protein
MESSNGAVRLVKLFYPDIHPLLPDTPTFTKASPHDHPFPKVHSGLRLSLRVAALSSVFPRVIPPSLFLICPLSSSFLALLAFVRLQLFPIQYHSHRMLSPCPKKPLLCNSRQHIIGTRGSLTKAERLGTISLRDGL